MSDTGEAALSLLEALVERLEAEGVLTPASIAAIYDTALALAQARQISGNSAAAGLQARMSRLRQ